MTNLSCVTSRPLDVLRQCFDSTLGFLIFQGLYDKAHEPKQRPSRNEYEVLHRFINIRITNRFIPLLTVPCWILHERGFASATKCKQITVDQAISIFIQILCGKRCSLQHFITFRTELRASLAEPFKLVFRFQLFGKGTNSRHAGFR